MHRSILQHQPLRKPPESVLFILSGAVQAMGFSLLTSSLCFWGSQPWHGQACRPHTDS